MPKINLTQEERRKARIEQRDKMLKALLESKMTIYSVSIKSLGNKIGVSLSGMYRRLQKPSERFRFDELCALFEALRISNEEICEIIRR